LIHWVTLLIQALSTNLFERGEQQNMAKVAINGLGRIGRAVFKIIHDHPELELVAVNDLVPPDNLAYLLKHDTVHGNYGKPVESNGNSLKIEGKEYKVFSEPREAKSKINGNSQS
jgi:glyceraldehyde 3-phosphate dehydrogenase